MGLFERFVMPCGVTNTPAHFMNMMNHLLSEYLDQFILVFVDDILVYSKFIEEHVEHLKKVLQKLEYYHLWSKSSKTNF